MNKVEIFKALANMTEGATLVLRTRGLGAPAAMDGVRVVVRKREDVLPGVPELTLCKVGGKKASARLMLSASESDSAYLFRQAGGETVFEEILEVA